MRFASLFVSALLLAGCADDAPADTASDAPPPEPELTANTYRLTLQSVPTDHLYIGERFEVGVRTTGTIDSRTDHLDIHIWGESEDSPTANSGTRCTARAADLPGTYTVSCNVPSRSGQHYVRGHVHSTSAGKTLDWWSPEAEITVH